MALNASLNVLCFIIVTISCITIPSRTHSSFLLSSPAVISLFPLLPSLPKPFYSSSLSSSSLFLSPIISPLFHIFLCSYPHLPSTLVSILSHLISVTHWQPVCYSCYLSIQTYCIPFSLHLIVIASSRVSHISLPLRRVYPVS